MIRSFLLATALSLCGSWAAAQDLALVPHQTLPGQAEVTALAFSTDGTMLLTGDARGAVRGWTVATAAEVFNASLDGDVLFLRMIRGDSAWVAVDDKGHVWLYQVDAGTLAQLWQTPKRPHRVALDGRGRLLAVAAENRRIDLYDLQARAVVGTIEARRELDELVFLGFDRLGSQLIAVSKRGEVVAWNPVTLRPLRKLTLQGGDLHGSRTKIHAASTNRNASVFVVGLEEVALPKGGLSGRARPGDLRRRDLVLAYDWETGVEVKRIEYPGGEVQHIALGPGNDRVAVAGKKSKELAFVDLREGELESAVTTQDTPQLLAVSPADDWLAAGTKQGNTVLWKIQGRTGDSVAELGESLPTLAGRIRIIGEQTPILSPDSTTTLAILPFDDRGVSEDIAAVVADVLTTNLANLEHLRLVERLRVEALLSEFALQAQGVTEADGLTLGKMLNADYVVLGSIGALGKTYTLSTRLLDVETTQVVSGRQVVCEACRLQDLFDAITLLGTTIAR